MTHMTVSDYEQALNNLGLATIDEILGWIYKHKPEKTRSPTPKRNARKTMRTNSPQGIGDRQHKKGTPIFFDHGDGTWSLIRGSSFPDFESLKDKLSQLIGGSIKNDGKAAEVVVRERLEEYQRSGKLSFVDRTNERNVGYDFLVKIDSVELYVEVKSSTNYCSPRLTSNEWKFAQNNLKNYVLYIFDDIGHENVNIKSYLIPDQYEPTKQSSFCLTRSKLIEL
jgi:hypothetical protein